MKGLLRYLEWCIMEYRHIYFEVKKEPEFILDKQENRCNTHSWIDLGGINNLIIFITSIRLIILFHLKISFYLLNGFKYF